MTLVTPFPHIDRSRARDADDQNRCHKCHAHWCGGDPPPPPLIESLGFFQFRAGPPPVQPALRARARELSTPDVSDGLGAFCSRAAATALYWINRRSESGAGLLICRVTARRQRQRTSTPQVLSSLGCGSRHIMAGTSAASAWSCRRTGSRSPSVARCRMQRASSLARTFSMPLHLSVNQASSNAASRIASVLGSNDPLQSPRMFPLSDRILLEAGPPEHHHDMATLWSLPAINCTRAMHRERSIAAVSRASTLGTLRLQPQIVQRLRGCRLLA